MLHGSQELLAYERQQLADRDCLQVYYEDHLATPLLQRDFEAELCAWLEIDPEPLMADYLPTSSRRLADQIDNYAEIADVAGEFGLELD